MIDAILCALDNPQHSALRHITVIEENGEEKSISYAALAQQALAVSFVATDGMRFDWRLALHRRATRKADG